MDETTKTKDQADTSNLPVVYENKGELAPYSRNPLILATEDEIAELLLSLPPKARRKAKRRIKREIRYLRSKAEFSHVLGNTSIGVGGLGSAIGASGLLAVVAPAVAITPILIAVTVGGFVVAAGGFGASVILGRSRIDKIEKAQHLEDLAAEAPNE